MKESSGDHQEWFGHEHQLKTQRLRMCVPGFMFSAPRFSAQVVLYQHQRLSRFSERQKKKTKVLLKKGRAHPVVNHYKCSADYTCKQTKKKKEYCFSNHQLTSPFLKNKNVGMALTSYFSANSWLGGENIKLHHPGLKKNPKRLAFIHLISWINPTPAMR